MFDKVIIGIDERQSRDDAIRLARQLVSENGTLILAHVFSGAPVVAKGMALAYDTNEREHSKRLLQVVSDATGIQATASIGASSVGRGLHELAERHGADLLVIGSNRRGLVGRVLVGDGTHDAINGCCCAVALAPAAYGDSIDSIRKIGVGYDQSPQSEQALSIARDLAAEYQAQVTVMAAVGLPLYWYYGFGTPYTELAQEALRATQEELEKLPDVEAHVAYGDAAEELAAFSQTVDLLVLGSRDFGPVGHLVHSGVTKRLANSSRCPLLVTARVASHAPHERHAEAQHHHVIESIADQADTPPVSIG